MRVSGSRPTLTSIAAACSALAGSAGAQTQVFHLPARVTDEGLGASVDFVGDVDGDGIDDFVAGAPNHPPASSGKAYLCSGADRSVLLSWLPPIDDGSFGYPVSAAGDVDLDGVPDVLVGAPYIQGLRGRVWVYSGLDGSTIYEYTGEVPNSVLGKSVAELGDVDGDGWPDFAIGATGFTGVPSKVYVRSGRDGGLHWVLTGPTEWFGYAIAGLGDIDGDGLGDVIVG